MLEFITAFTIFGSSFVFILFVIAILLVLIIGDINEVLALPLVCLGIFLGFIYFWGNVSLGNVFTFRNVGIYLFIGFVFSLVRTYFKGKELTTQEKKQYDLKSSVFRWWFLFPISAINWIFGHLLVDVYNFIYAKTEKIYLAIFNS